MNLLLVSILAVILGGLFLSLRPILILGLVLLVLALLHPISACALLLAAGAFVFGRARW